MLIILSATIICPDDLIATVTALTLAIRVIGGSIGYTVYYNVFVNKFVPSATLHIGGYMTAVMSPPITDINVIIEAIKLTGASLLPPIVSFPKRPTISNPTVR